MQAALRLYACADGGFTSPGMNAWECDIGSQGKCMLSFYFLSFASHFLAWTPLLQSRSGVLV